MTFALAPAIIARIADIQRDLAQLAVRVEQAGQVDAVLAATVLVQVDELAADVGNLLRMFDSETKGPG